MTHDDLIPGRVVRAPTKEVRKFVLELGDTVDLYFYNGRSYTVKWKACGLGLTKVWMEPSPDGNEEKGK